MEIKFKLIISGSTWRQHLELRNELNLKKYKKQNNYKNLNNYINENKGTDSADIKVCKPFKICPLKINGKNKFSHLPIRKH